VHGVGGLRAGAGAVLERLEDEAAGRDDGALLLGSGGQRGRVVGVGGGEADGERQRGISGMFCEARMIVAVLVPVVTGRVRTGS